MKLRYLLIVILVWLGGCDQKKYLQDTQGNTFALEDLRGQWVLVNYWAIWCRPCIEEVQELNAINTSQKNVTVLGFNYDRLELTELQRQIKLLDIQFTVTVSNPGAQLSEPYALPSVLPTTLVINPQGELAATLVGPQTSKGLIAKLSNLAK